MQIVELAHTRIPGMHHLEEGGAGDVVYLLGREGEGCPIHRLTPTPEIGMWLTRRTPLRATPDQPLEGMGVGIHETGEEGTAMEILDLDTTSARTRLELLDRADLRDQTTYLIDRDTPA